MEGRQQANRAYTAVPLFREWTACQNLGLRYSNGDTWDRMLQQWIQLLDRFCQDDRIRIRPPRRNLQIKFTRSISEKNDFVAYVDAIGKVDGTRCLIEWKTTSSRYPEEPDGLLALDPQLVCYHLHHWIHDFQCLSLEYAGAARAVETGSAWC